MFSRLKRLFGGSGAQSAPSPGDLPADAPSAAAPHDSVPDWVVEPAEDMFAEAVAEPAPSTEPPVRLPKLVPKSRSNPEPAQSPASTQAQAELKALMAARSFEAATRIADGLPPEIRIETWFIRTRLTLAAQLKHHEDALRYGTDLLARKPGEVVAFRARAAALRALGRRAEADAELAAGLAACKPNLALVTDYAASAEMDGHPDLALRRLLQATESGLEPGPLYFNLVTLAQRLERLDLAEQLLARGLSLVPAHRGLLLRAARHAVRRRDWPEAQNRFTQLLEAEPENAELAMEAVRGLYGGRAGREERLVFIRGVLDRLHAGQPDFVPAYAFHVRLLRDSRSLDEASRLLPGWLERFPADPGLAIEAARLRIDQGDMQGAIQTLRSAQEHGASDAGLDAELIGLLCRVGGLDEADRLCQAALEAAPDNVALIEQYVSLASRRGDMDEAARRITSTRARFPDNRAISFALNRLSLLQDDHSDSATHATGRAQGGAQMFARFESMGSTNFGCEFGMVQKQFGADPIGLLRWSRMSVPGLVRALDAGFEGMGEPENTRISVGAPHNGDLEYLLHDDRYDYYGHTFIKQSEAAEAVVYRQTCRRLKFLRGKLLEDLAEASKIFVFKMTVFEGVPAVQSIFAALRRYGPVTFLCATSADTGNPGGSLEMLEPGLFIGRLARFGDAGPSGVSGIDAEGWRDLCNRVAAWHDAHATGAEVRDDVAG